MTSIVVTTSWPVAIHHTFGTGRSPFVYGQAPLVACTACSCTGVYVDYAGPGVAGGVAVACGKCGGKGWRPANPEAST